MFILQNQDGYFLSKSGEWIDGRTNNLLFRTPNKDEAVNQMFEINSRDYSLRINLMECAVNTKNLPVIPQELLPPPLTPVTEEADTTAMKDEETSDENAELFDDAGNEDDIFSTIQSQSA